MPAVQPYATDPDLRLQASPLKCRATDAASVFWYLWNECEEKISQLVVVCAEHFKYRFMANRFGFPLNPNVVVGNEGDVDVADLELARQVRLRILGHVDDFPTGILKPL